MRLPARQGIRSREALIHYLASSNAAMILLSLLGSRVSLVVHMPLSYLSSWSAIFHLKPDVLNGRRLISRAFMRHGRGMPVCLEHVQ
jgi:hypothetical protein